MSDDYSSPIRRNWCDGPGAVEVAERLRNHWRDRGAEIRTRFETTLRSESDGRVTVQSVRSDMVNGLPRGWSSAKGWQSIGEIAGRRPPVRRGHPRPSNQNADRAEQTGACGRPHASDK